MHIYIDESGIFRPEKNSRASCVAALVIPSSKKVRLLNDYRQLSASWPTEKGEVKGRLLTENQIAQVVSLLQKNDVLLEVNAIDSGLQTEDELLQLKKNMTNILHGWIIPGHPLEEEITQIAKAYEETSLQLFIQAFLMQTLIYRVIQHSISYYARRIPKELGVFLWVVDGKDKNISEFEKAWSTVIFPSVAYQSEVKPFDLLEGGDYSYLERYYSANPEALAKARAKVENPDEIGIFRLKELLGKSFRFLESKDQPGLQLVDILASAVCRAFNGNLQKDGWGEIGTLMVQRPLQSIPFILPQDGQGVFGTPKKIVHPFSPVVEALTINNKPMLLDPLSEARLMKKNRKKKKKLWI